MPADLNTQLDEAVARGSAATLSLPSDGMVRDYRTRFLEMGTGGLWIEGVTGEQPLIDQLIRTAEPCPVTFNAFGSVVQFKSRVLSREAAHTLGTGVQLQALLLEHPDHVATVQRRNNYRVKVPAGTPLSVRAWRLAEIADLNVEPGPGTQLDLSVVDLSATGMGAIVRLGAFKYGLAARQRLRMLVRLRSQQDTLLSGRVMAFRPGPAEHSVHVGIHFDDLKSGIDGRKTEALLGRILAELERAEIRQRKGLD